MQKAPHITEVAEYLRQHGIYPTGHRLAIAKALLTRHQHLTADQLYFQLRDQGVQISRATVYNSLNLFVQHGREIVLDATHTYFDSNNSQHHHFYNVDDNVLIDAPVGIGDLVPQMDLPEGTRLDSVEVVVKIRNST